MKKSEALFQLVQLLVITNNEELGYAETAQEILALIEAMGMRPPQYEGLIRDASKWDRNNIEHQGKDTMFFRGWEPE